MAAVALALDEEIDAAIGVGHARQDVAVAVSIEAHAEKRAPPGAVHVDFEVHDAAALEAEVEVVRSLARGRAAYARATIGIPNGEALVGGHVGATNVADIEVLRGGGSLVVRHPAVLSVEVL